MKRVWIRRSVFGWWVALNNPDEALASMDTNTIYRAFTRERLLRKLGRRFAVRPSPWTEVAVADLPEPE